MTDTRHALDVLFDPKQRSGCVRCGRCCRRWHVALMPGEAEALRARQWPEGVGADPVVRIGKESYLAHRANGDCIYLDPETSLCRLELKHGYSAKPLGCRIFPLNLATVLPGTVSCGVRFDCPGIQQGAGKPLGQQREEIAGFVREIGIGGDVDAYALAALNPATIRVLAEFLAELATAGDANPATGGLALLLACRHLTGLGPIFLNDGETLRDILPALREKFRADAAALLRGAKPVGALDRALFRLWFSSYLRRDEELLWKPVVCRILHAWQIQRIFLGGGRLSMLGMEHPAVPPPSLVGDAAGRWAADPAVWTAWRRWMAGRLRTLQFFGRAWYHVNFFEGVAALAATGPLMAAAARAHAAARAPGEGVLTAADVEYATGAIDHSFGRSVLHMKWHQRLIGERFEEPARSAALLAVISGFGR